jgi:spore maturation protein SpmA
MIPVGTVAIIRIWAKLMRIAVKDGLKPDLMALIRL